MASLALIVNASSSGNRRDPRRASRLSRLVGRRGEVVVTRSPDELPAICTQLETMNPSIVGICGGDGTLHHTITALIDAYGDAPLPRIAILRAGAMNIVADSLAIGAGAPLVRALVGTAHETRSPRLEAFEHAVLRVGRRFGFLFGTGVIHEFLQQYYTVAHPNAGTALGLLLRAIASGVVGGPLTKHIYRPFQAHVIADGTPWPRTRFVTLCAATVEQIGLGFRPFVTCRERLDGFAVLGIDTTPIGLMRELPRIHAGKPIRREKALDGVAQEITITAIDPGTLGYMIDGDLYTSERTLTVNIGPALKFVRLRG